MSMGVVGGGGGVKKGVCFTFFFFFQVYNCISPSSCHLLFAFSLSLPSSLCHSYLYEYAACVDVIRLIILLIIRQ